MLRERGRATLAGEIAKSPSQKEILSAKLKALFSEPPKTFGGKLKYFRIKNNLLQKDLAGILKVHKVTICRYEKNLSYPSGKIIEKINRIINAHSFVNSMLKEGN
ncbi:MAG: helix-turn-helix transcriptional regulator [bacterium]